MADTATALGSLGSDLAFSVSFGIGRELLDAAREAQMSEDELIASVLVLSIVFTALPRTFKVTVREMRLRGWLGSKAATLSTTESGLLAFGALLVDIARRIAISLSVQLLAANVRAKQPNRAVRVVSLLSVAIFFLFLGASATLEHTPTAPNAPNAPNAPDCTLTGALLRAEASSSIGLKVRRE